MIIENPAYKKWNGVDWEKRWEWIRSISLGDMAIYRTYNGIVEGKIEMINNYGMDISTNGVYKYVRWGMVVSIRKIDS